MEFLVVLLLVAVVGYFGYRWYKKKEKEEAGQTALILRAGDAQKVVELSAQEAEKKVVVAFASVVLQPVDGERLTFTFTEPKQINLLAADNPLGGVLVDEVVPAGEYEWIRLMVVEGASYLESDGIVNTIEIPSGAQTGLKLVSGFVLPEGGAADFTIDFDLKKSLTITGNGKYILRPTLKLIDNSQPEEEDIEG